MTTIESIAVTIACLMVIVVVSYCWGAGRDE